MNLSQQKRKIIDLKMKNFHLSHQGSDSAVDKEVRLSIRALRTLIAVRRYSSFRAAAEAEGLTPSAVSHQMKNLEQMLDLRLFDRSTKMPALTPKGLALAEEASTLVDSYDNLAAKISSSDVLSGEMIIGAVPTSLTGIVPEGLSNLKAKHPSIMARVVPGLTNQLLRQLERGQIHMAVISRPEILPDSLTFSELVTQELVLLVPAATESIPPRELLTSTPFIRFTRESVVGKQIEAWLQKQGIQVTDAMELEGLDAISSMVAAGLGVSIVPVGDVATKSRLQLKTLPLERNGPRRIIGLASRTNSTHAPMINAAKVALMASVPKMLTLPAAKLDL